MRRRASRSRGLGLNVRVRMTLWYLAILAAVFVIFGAIVSGIVVHQDELATQEALITMAGQLAATYQLVDGVPQVAFPRNTTPAPTPAPAKTSLPDGEPLAYRSDDIALLVTERGQVTTTLGPLAAGASATILSYALPADTAHPAPLTPFLTLSLPIITPKGPTADAPYDLYRSPIQSQGRRVATLVVGRVHAGDQTLQSLVPGLLVAGPLTLLVAALGGYWLASRALRPVRLITQAAREIGETDLSRRLGLTSHDELGELAATFDGMLARLEAAFARQRQFTADASHELRTPLTIVGLEATRALAERRTPEEYARALTTIQAENDAMSQLVNDLLLLVRADAGQLGARHAAMDVSALALEVVERLAPLARHHGITLAVGALPELMVMGDDAHLTRMLSNLLVNAISHTAGIGTSVRVESGAGRAGWAWLRVTDDGPGISEAHLPRIFDRFYRVDDARSVAPDHVTPGDDAPGTEDGPPPTGGGSGSGLGLSIAQLVARAHGGEVRVHSAVGRGSVFEVWLPML